MDETVDAAAHRGGMPENIVLVGLMGAGKTSVGRALAKRLHKTFYDADHEIERATGVGIPLIFEIEGETGFRARESRMLAELTRRTNIVLATGGGAVLDEANRELLTRCGTVVYLRAGVDDLWRRTRRDRNRPLLQVDDPRARLRSLFEQRDPLYRQIADLVVDTGTQSVGALAHRLEQMLALLPPRPRAGCRKPDADAVQR
jgi:shikimate kinase